MICTLTLLSGTQHVQKLGINVCLFDALHCPLLPSQQ